MFYILTLCFFLVTPLQGMEKNNKEKESHKNPWAHIFEARVLTFEQSDDSEEPNKMSGAALSSNDAHHAVFEKRELNFEPKESTPEDSVGRVIVQKDIFYEIFKPRIINDAWYERVNQDVADEPKNAEEFIDMFKKLPSAEQNRRRAKGPFNNPSTGRLYIFASTLKYDEQWNIAKKLPLPWE